MLTLVSLPLALGAWTALGAPSELSWDASPELRCPSGAQLDRAFETHLGGALALRRGSPTPGQLGVYVGSGPAETLHVWLWTEPEETHPDRALAVEGVGCPQRAEAVALIVDAWLKAWPPGVETGLATAAAAAPLPAGAPAAQVTLAGVPPPTPEASAVVGSASDPQWDKDRPLVLDLRGAVVGLAGLGANAFGVGGALALDFWIGRYFGMGGQVAIVTDLVGTDSVVPGGQVTVGRQAFTFYGALHPAPAQLPGLAVLAGVQLQHLDAHTTGFPVDGEQSVFPVALWGGVNYGWELASSLAFFAQLETSVGFSDYQFYVAGPPGAQRTLVTIPAVSMALLVGLLVNVL